MTAGDFDTTLDCAVALDRADMLGALAERFDKPRIGGESTIYLCGHSLGLMPTDTRTVVSRELDAWARHAVDAHFGEDGGWYAYHERFAGPLAALLGVDSASVVAMNSLTVNLHLMLVSFFRPGGTRRKIVIERQAFPSDRYAVQSHLRWHGLDPEADLIELGSTDGAGALTPDGLDHLLSQHAGEVALVLLPGVQFLTGQALSIPEFAAVARRHDAMAGFDLAHSVGNLSRPLANSDADFAVWCSYKYLNAGPGAIGGCYVHPRWHAQDLPRFEGWWGHDKQRRFDLDDTFVPIGTAEAWQLSNPPILAMAPLQASLALFQEAGIENLRAKSITQTAYLQWLMETVGGERCRILTPSAADARGCQLSIRLDLGATSASSFVEQLAAEKVIVDWRRPDILRLTPVPLYNSFEDIYRAVQAITAALAK